MNSSKISSGIAVASVLGVPTGTLIGELADWRTAFTVTGSALFVATFNVAISLGALLGGLAVDAISTSSVMWAGGILVVLTMATVLIGRSAPTPAPAVSPPTRL